MAKIDEIKEHIGALKGYMNIIVALILTIGAGIAKLYTLHEINILFWLGTVFILGLFVLFIFLAKNIHNNIKKLKDL